MKKNFFATLIIVALVVVMSFSLTSCDIFDRGHGNNSGSNGTDSGATLGLDASKLTERAKADKDAQKIALMIDDEWFDKWENDAWDFGMTMIVAREDLANLFAEVFSSARETDSGRVYYNDYQEESDGSIGGKNGFFANGYTYEVLKESDVTMEEYYTTAIGETINDKICVHDEETQNDCYRGFIQCFNACMRRVPMHLLIIRQ